MMFVFMTSKNIYASGESSGISYFSYFLNLMSFIIIFIGVILLAMYSTKFIAKRANYLGKDKYLTVLDSINLGGNIKIITIKIYNQIYILSITNNTTTLIDKLSEEDIDIDIADYLEGKSNEKIQQREFSEYIDYFKEKISKKNKE